MKVELSAGSLAPVSRRQDLATLASIAAIELDKRARGHASELTEVAQLAVEIKKSVRQTTANGPKSGLLDPLASDLFGRALVEGQGVAPVSSTTDLATRVVAMIEKLESSNTKKGDAASFERLRDFCLALSRSALTGTWPQPVEQQHPYRR